MSDQREDLAAAFVDIVFDGPPSDESGRFVEVEDPSGASISVGTWLERNDGYWVLRIPDPRRLASREAQLAEAENSNYTYAKKIGQLEAQLQRANRELLRLRERIETKERELLSAAVKAEKESGLAAWDRGQKLRGEADELRAFLTDEEQN